MPDAQQRGGREETERRKSGIYVRGAHSSAAAEREKSKDTGRGPLHGMAGSRCAALACLRRCLLSPGPKIFSLLPFGARFASSRCSSLLLFRLLRGLAGFIFR